MVSQSRSEAVLFKQSRRKKDSQTKEETMTKTKRNAIRRKYLRLYNRKYRKTKKHKEFYKRWSKDNPKKVARNKSHMDVHRALRLGLLFKKSCQVCKIKNAEAHHDSYLPEDSLRVRWLCKIHHEEWHMENTPIYSP